MRRALTRVSGACLLILASSGVFSTASTAGSGGPLVDDISQDSHAYAKAFGVTVAEARSALQVQEAVSAELESSRTPLRVRFVHGSAGGLGVEVRRGPGEDAAPVAAALRRFAGVGAVTVKDLGLTAVALQERSDVAGRWASRVGGVTAFDRIGDEESGRILVKVGTQAEVDLLSVAPGRPPFVDVSVAPLIKPSLRLRFGLASPRPRVPWGSQSGRLLFASRRPLLIAPPPTPTSMVER